MMLVVGIVVGPAVGLALGRLLSHSQTWRGWRKVVAIAVLALAIAVIPIGDLGLRLGFDAGMVLGTLLWMTPIPASNPAAVVHPARSVAGAPPAQETNTL